jgi:phage repressor protein C with HTH and peptisase S24 domain
MEMGKEAAHAVEDASVDFVRSEAEHLLKLQGARFREARVRAHLTIEEVATRAGLHSNTVGRIERGQAEASAEQLLRIARVIDVAPITVSLFGGQPTVSPDDEEFVLIQMVDVHLSAGHGANNSYGEALGRFAFRRSWLDRHGLNSENARLMTARGKSMADKINDGDILLVDTRVKTLKEDGIYVIERDGLDYVKLLQRDFQSGGVHIISYNSDYPPQFVARDQEDSLRISGRVLWHGGDL